MTNPSPSVLTLLTFLVEGWPEHEDDRAGVFPLSEVLAGRYDSDVHFTAYTAAIERRHTSGSLARAEEAGVQMVAAVFDVDGTNHRASDEWWAGELEKLQPFIETGAFVYRTRGGYRIVYELEQPVPINTAEDAAQWTRTYVAWCTCLEREYGIIADRKCKDWQHLFRAPHATRDDVLLELPTYGDPGDIGVWDVDASKYVIAEVPEKNSKNPKPLGSPVIAPAMSLKDSAAKLLADHWPKSGDRANARLALVGACVHSGWSREDAADFAKRVHAHIPDRGDATDASLDDMVVKALAKKNRGEPVVGWPTLGDYVGHAIAASAKGWLTKPDPEGAAQFEAFINRPKDAPEQSGPKRTRPSDRARRLGSKDVVRLSTGLPSVDNATRGGILLRKLAVIGGAPGAGKTALLCKLAYTWLSKGVPVGLLASDEDADALLIRLGQLHGLARDDLEGGNSSAREALAAWCDSVPLLLADGDEEDATIEAVSKELRDVAGGGPSVLLVDSMQTARTGTELPKGADLRTRVNEAVRVLKRAAKVDGHLVVASSELAKAAYRNKAQADNINALSAFKESGDIEYGVAFALVLVSSPGTNDLVNAEIVKNRLGAGKPAFVLKLDHARANVSETAREEQELRDPLTFVKDEVLETIQEHGALTSNRIYGIIGGRKTLVLSAIKALLDAKKVIQATEGIRFPLPGEGGYTARGTE